MSHHTVIAEDGAPRNRERVWPRRAKLAHAIFLYAIGTFLLCGGIVRNDMTALGVGVFGLLTGALVLADLAASRPGLRHNR